jgi:hypothetical protein
LPQLERTGGMIKLGFTLTAEGFGSRGHRLN